MPTSLQGSVNGKVPWYDIEKHKIIWVDKAKVEQTTAHIHAFVEARRREIEAEIEAFRRSWLVFSIMSFCISRKN
jgi:hypothetical protein